MFQALAFRPVVTLTFDRTKLLCFSPFGLTYTPQFFEKLIGSLRISETLLCILRLSEKKLS